MNDLTELGNGGIEQRAVNYDAAVEPQRESTLQMVSAILRRWYIALLIFVLICGIGIPLIWFSIEPLYTVTGAIRVAPILENIITGKVDSGGISNYQSFMRTQAEMMTSDKVLQRVADQLADKNLSFFQNKGPALVTRLKEKLDIKNSPPEALEKLRNALSKKNITIVPGSKTELIKISMKSANPQEAKIIVNSFIDAYMAVEVSDSSQGQEQKLRLLEDERKTLTEKLQSRHNAIRQLAQEYGTTNLVSRQDMRLKRVTTLLGELTELEAKRISLETQVELLKKSKEQVIAPDELLKMQSNYINSDPTVTELTSKIIQLEQELIVAKQTLASTNPELQKKQAILDTFKERLEDKRRELAADFDRMSSSMADRIGREKLEKVQAELAQTRAYEQRLREVLNKEDVEAIQIGRKQLEIEDLQFQLELDRHLYDTVCRRIQELEMERKQPARVKVAYDASIVAVLDKRKKYGAALVFVALACGMGLALARDKADKRLRTPSDVVERIGIRIIGTTTDPQSIKRKLLPQQVVEDYQSIRANLGLLHGDGIPGKLVVTSPRMREGKTTFAVNLATSMAKSGKKILLIDGDMRKPDIASFLHLPKGCRGLQEFIFGAEFTQVVFSMADTGLDVLSADSHNSSDAYELLALPRTAKKINSVAEQYDHVVIDSPPVLAFPDALLWAKIAGAVVLTSFAGQTTAPDLKEAKEKLSQINVKLLGTILSNVPARHSYYRYAYGYYDRNGRGKQKQSPRDKKLLLPIYDSQGKAGNVKSQPTKSTKEPLSQP